MVGNRLDKTIDIDSILALHNAIRKRGAIIYCRQLLAEILLEHIGIVEPLDELVDNVSLLIGKVDQLRNLLKVSTILAELIDASLLALHNKSRVLKGLYVTIHRTV